MTDEELLAFSRRNEPYRIERNAKGELKIMSPAGGEGGEWEAVVIRNLGNWAEEHGGHSFSSSTGFSLRDGSVLSPDAAWVSEARWSALSRDERRSYPPLCPEFVVEVRSASDTQTALEAKMELWIANGAQLAWMIDPYGAAVRICRPNAAVVVLDRPDSVEAEDVVPGFRLTTRGLWEK